MDLLILFGVPILATILFSLFYNVILAPFNLYSNIRKSKLGYTKPTVPFYVLAFSFTILFIYLYIGVLSIYFNFVLNNFESLIIYYITCFVAYTIIPITLWKKVVKYQKANRALRVDSKSQSEYNAVWEIIKSEKNQYVDLFALNGIMITLLIVIVLIAIYPSLLQNIWGFFKIVSF
ncbi:MAG: hypothetical protein H7263_03945 [Candidatus Sericytochromatia bacterium]|nr:hypothetical protein [Candidatus Sericytochromatia bacterium]